MTLITLTLALSTSLPGAPLDHRTSRVAPTVIRTPAFSPLDTPIMPLRSPYGPQYQAETLMSAQPHLLPSPYASAGEFRPAPAVSVLPAPAEAPRSFAPPPFRPLRRRQAAFPARLPDPGPAFVRPAAPMIAPAQPAAPLSRIARNNLAEPGWLASLHRIFD